MAESTKRGVPFGMAPQLLSDRLGKGLYRAGEALKQLVSNSLDAGCTVVDVTRSRF
jgi:hypothetical protein